MVAAGVTDADKNKLREAILNPVLFGRTILGYDLWELPNAILAALSRPHARVAVRSCHASGKSHLSGGVAVPWYMIRFKDAVVVTTAPTWAQVKDVLWKEVHTSIARSRIGPLPEANNTEWRYDKDHYAIGLSTTEAERFSGFHAPHVLIILDEAPGVRPEIWEAIEGISAGGDVRVLALGNPTISAGPFYQAFSTNRSQWTTFTIDGFDTPNLQGVPGHGWQEKMQTLLEWEERADPQLDENPRPYLITRRWILERYHEWGPNSPLWMARVRGRHPTQSATSLIALGWAEGIRLGIAKYGSHCLGVDVARYGNNYTSYCLLHGNQIRRMWRVQGRDTHQTASEIVRMYRDDPTLTVVVDDSGVGGGVVDQLLAENVPVVPFNAGETPRYNDDVLNRGSEAYWNLSLALRDGEVAVHEDVSLETFDFLVEQLVQIEYNFNGKRKIQVHKEGIKKDRPSPDFADSLNMAWEAHRLEINNPGATSVEIAPGPDSGLGSFADRPKLWSGGVGGGSGRPSTALTVPQPEDEGADPMRPVRLGAVCPACTQLADLRELGKSGGMRNYQLSCKNCGHSQVIRHSVGGPGSPGGSGPAAGPSPVRPDAVRERTSV